MIGVWKLTNTATSTIKTVAWVLNVAGKQYRIWLSFRRPIALSTWILYRAIVHAIITSCGWNWGFSGNGGILPLMHTGTISLMSNTWRAKITSSALNWLKTPLCAVTFLSDVDPGKALRTYVTFPLGETPNWHLNECMCPYDEYVALSKSSLEGLCILISKLSIMSLQFSNCWKLGGRGWFLFERWNFWQWRLKHYFVQYRYEC